MAGKNNKESRGQGEGGTRGWGGGAYKRRSRDSGALLAYAVHPSTRDVHIIVRQQSGVTGNTNVHCIDVLKLFQDLTAMRDWPTSFTNLQRVLPIIYAYVLNGTDFTPTLSGLTASSMSQAYYDALKDAGNHNFVLPLGSE
ncbi:unnamed protein product [Ectocarpus sp. CCAP 1310/34]|nr:unnamed protein product [Ectocarpus sp. CCAP 1310/34]